MSSRCLSSVPFSTTITYHRQAIRCMLKQIHTNIRKTCTEDIKRVSKWDAGMLMTQCILKSFSQHILLKKLEVGFGTSPAKRQMTKGKHEMTSIQ
mmetsp:Transcript_124331/g.232533  ORF Transcript_124331/g.232533 Transcript_124331/m.232533 type:complete len:95 (+) Transcript_124331:2214-2498(+)